MRSHAFAVVSERATAADLELGLGGSDLALGLAVGDRHAQVAGEQQHLVDAVAEAFEDVAGLGLAATANAAMFGEPDHPARVATRCAVMGEE
jgi:hypothetical protein